MRSAILSTLVLVGCGGGGNLMGNPINDAGMSTNLDGHLNTNPGQGGDSCATACDCTPGTACTGGVCTANSSSPTYCCESANCPSGDSCQAMNGSFSNCATTTTGANGTNGSSTTGATGTIGGLGGFGGDGGIIGGLSGSSGGIIGGSSGGIIGGSSGGLTGGAGGGDGGIIGGLTGGGGSYCQYIPCSSDGTCTQLGCTSCGSGGMCM